MLRGLGLDVRVLPSDVDESVYDALPIPERVRALALLKVKACLGSRSWPGAGLPRFVVGADTLVGIDGDALGKPASMEEARSMLGLLSGRTHDVATGVCVADAEKGLIETAVSESSVTFRDLTASEIGWYLEAGEWRGAAGAYRIQGLASYFVTRIEGSFSGVVGLPLDLFYAILCRLGFAFPSGGRADAASGTSSGAESSAV